MIHNFQFLAGALTIGRPHTTQIKPWQHTLMAVTHFPHGAFQFKLGAVGLQAVLHLQLQSMQNYF